MSTATASVEALHAALGARGRGARVESSPRPDRPTPTCSRGSTPRRRAAPRRAPCLLVAARQTAGRGRHGRAWQARRGRVAHLLARLAVGTRRPLGPVAGGRRRPGRAIDRPPARRRDRLKWPNDLWLLDRTHAAQRRRPQARRRADRDGAGRARPRRRRRRRHQRAAAAGRRRRRAASPRCAEIDAGATPLTTLARVAPALIAALRRFDDAASPPFAASLRGARPAARPAMRQRRRRAADVDGVAIGVDADRRALVRHRRRRSSVTERRVQRAPRRCAAAPRRGEVAVLRALVVAAGRRQPAVLRLHARLRSTACSGCARSAIASPSGSPSRSAREIDPLLPDGAAASAPARRGGCLETPDRSPPPTRRRRAGPGQQPAAPARGSTTAARASIGSKTEVTPQLPRRQRRRGAGRAAGRRCKLDPAGRGFSPCAKSERPR